MGAQSRLIIHNRGTSSPGRLGCPRVLIPLKVRALPPGPAIGRQHPTYPILRDAEVANVEERGATLLKIFRTLFQVCPSNRFCWNFFENTPDSSRAVLKMSSATSRDLV